MAKRKKISPASLMAQAKNKRVNKKKLHAAAVFLGRKGGQAGGPARAEVLSDQRKTDIGIHAACARWNIKCTCTNCLRSRGFYA